jgi:hypothetical protein
LNNPTNQRFSSSLAADEMTQMHEKTPVTSLCNWRLSGEGGMLPYPSRLDYRTPYASSVCVCESCLEKPAKKQKSDKTEPKIR